MQKRISRTAVSKRNLTVSVISRIVGMITSFVGRSIFVKTLSAEYLGLGGFFGNIFAVVSLCELGFGAAISQSLYKPLHEGDEYKQAAIINYFTKIYRIVAAVSLGLSLMALPVLDEFVHTELDKKIVVSAYLLFCVHGFFSFILAPKTNLVACDGRLYILSFAKSVVSVLSLIVQSIILVMTGNYLLYLTARIVFVFASDVLINMYADKKYPYLLRKVSVDESYKNSVYCSVKALIFHKIGAVLNRNTDSLLLSHFVGLAGLGKYSNYALVIGTIGAFFDVAMNAVSSSVGDLGAENRGKKAEGILSKLCFINFYLLTVGTCVIICVLNPFVKLWLGEQMLFSDFEMIIIVASFYFSCIRDPVQIFINTFGLFRESRFLPILRAVLNLCLSVIFVGKMGISGVFLGTVLSTAAVPLFGEIWVLCKHGLHRKSTPLIKEMCSYIAVSFVVAGACFIITKQASTDAVGILVRALTALLVSNILLITMYKGDEKYTFAKRAILGKILPKG